MKFMTCKKLGSTPVFTYRAILASTMVFALGCETTRSRFNVHLTMIAEPQVSGPCLTSLIGPVAESCIPWEPNVDAAPTYEMARRLIFVGAADDFLHVLDADKGTPFAQIKTQGRVVTETKFNADKTIFYVGTDKGVVEAFDAFSFAKLFSFTANGKVNNNLTMIENALVFTSSMGKIYSIDGKTGAVNWEVFEPLATERLRLSSHANIFVYERTNLTGVEVELVVPHADGYVSVLDSKTGIVKNKITLGVREARGFPDIAAPMVFLKNSLWVASYDHGLFALDVGSWQIRERVDVKEIVELSTDGRMIYAATPNNLLAITDMGAIRWNNHFADVKTKLGPLAYPFHQTLQGRKRLFYGVPSRVLVHNEKNALVMATSAGSLGIFDKTNGQLKKILGNLVGFGPKIDWAEPDSFVVVSRRGLLMKFRFAESHMNDKHRKTPFFEFLRSHEEGGDES